jgi:alginate O-acetyltransferase complex protein AlgI
LYFLPLTLLLYFLAPGRSAKNYLLLVVSLIFYAWGEPVYIVLMVASIFANWLFGMLVEKTQRWQKKLFLVLDVTVNLALLCLFKYESFLAENINAVVGFALVPDLELPLPIGISFYTLQALSYVVDVYRKEVPAQKNPFFLGMYISMFPQLIAGPIVRYATIQDQILNRKENLQDFSAGVRLFCIGLAKKVLLANIVAIYAAEMLAQGGATIGLAGAWLGLLAYTFQIFFDFSGYSDMAIGLGKMFGFKYLRNFNYPYISKSVSEFWRRWHISLYTFFRDYIYIPLGGSRVSKGRWIFNAAVVWFLTGFWHGAAWNYIFWGLYYLAFLLMEKFFLAKVLAKLPKIVQHFYTILVFMFGWLLFWIEDLNAMRDWFVAMFGGFGLTGTSIFWEMQGWAYLPVFAICILASTPLVPWLRARLVSWAKCVKPTNFMKEDIPNTRHLSTDTLCDTTYQLASIKEASTHSPQRYAVASGVFLMCDLLLVVLLVVCIMSVASGSFNPFIYFRF